MLPLSENLVTYVYHWPFINFRKYERQTQRWPDKKKKNAKEPLIRCVALVEIKFTTYRLDIKLYAHIRIPRHACAGVCCSWKSIAMRHSRRQTVRDELVGTKCVQGMSSSGGEVMPVDLTRGFILYFMADSPYARWS